MADSPSGTINSATPLKRLSVTSVAITGVMRSFITRNPLSAPIPMPRIRVTPMAGSRLEPFRIIQAKTTALRLMALPTDRSM
ncbi:MAG: hypothetical protein BWY83_01565 [bacterium ADurb.Bin478]|nr:MAG: hypothetical protein BWY83_01565 [bacterium ADurb.Bin478]